MTLAIEEPIAWLYCRRLRVLLVTSLANIATQCFLWSILTRYYDHYLLALFSAEGAIWALEALALRLCLPTRQALTLSLAMNATSFTLGWFLPV